MLCRTRTLLRLPLRTPRPIVHRWLSTATTPEPPKTDLDAEEIRRRKAAKANQERQTKARKGLDGKEEEEASTSSRFFPSASSTFTPYSFFAQTKPLPTAVFRDAEGKLKPIVAYDNYQPWKFRALMAFGVTSMLVWVLVGTATEAIAAVSPPTFFQNPVWSVVGLAGSMFFLYVCWAHAKKNVARLTLLANGSQARIETHTLWGKAKPIDAYINRITLSPLDREARSRQYVTLRVGADRNYYMIDRKNGILLNAFAFSAITRLPPDISEKVTTFFPRSLSIPENERRLHELAKTPDYVDHNTPSTPNTPPQK